MKNKAPLDAIRVLDLSRLLPGPLASLYLADLGAEIIKIEDPKGGDYARSIAPIAKEQGLFFLAVNRNKKSITLDFNNEDDLENFKLLLKTSDVLIESYRPGVLKKFGLDFKSVKNINPKLIYCSITGFGHTGPMNQKAGHDINYLALNGLLDQTGKADGPSLSNFQFADTAGGSLHAVIGIQAALLQRQHTGKGQFIDISMTDTSLAQAPVALSEVASGRSPIRGGEMLSGGLPNYGIYKTLDNKFMALGALEPKFFSLFLKTIEKLEWLKESNLDQLRSNLEELFLEKDQSEWASLFQEVDCCCTPILNLKEALSNEQILHRDLVFEGQHKSEGSFLSWKFPIKMSALEAVEIKDAPLLGEHNSELKNLL